jgi:hypothetical protein
MLERLAAQRYAGQVVVEINTRRATGRDRRIDDLAESLAFTRLHLAAARQAGAWHVNSEGEISPS